MIEHLVSSSLPGDHQSCAAGFIRLHVEVSSAGVGEEIFCTLCVILKGLQADGMRNRVKTENLCPVSPDSNT